MSITRREFTLVTTSLVALTVLGTSDQYSNAQGTGAQEMARKNRKPPVPKEVFTVGSPEQYRKPGVYDQYNKDKRLWLVSNGSKLVALVDVCTHLGCGLNWEPNVNLFECPCHKSKFDAAGTNQPDSKAKRPLERYAISLIDDNQGQGKIVQIDPTVRLRKDRDQWNDPRAEIDLPKSDTPAAALPTP